MLIAFEGPDNTGKSHSAFALSAGEAIYNATRDNYVAAKERLQPGEPQAFDRIDWLTHMAYRLALPDHDWNDDRPRTVFAMPDTHLVFKLHALDAVPVSDEEEGYTTGQPFSVNDMYYHLASMISSLNEVRNFSLFKTVTTLEVRNTPDGFTQRVVDFSSPVFPFGTKQQDLVTGESTLRELFEYEQSCR